MRQERDLRRYTRQTNARLLIGFFVILVVVGLGTIYLIWGQNSALLGLVCIGAALAPALLIWLVLGALGWIAKKMDQG